MERFPLSSTMLAHKLQIHLFTQAGWAKISTFLNDLYAEETLCISDEEYNYMFRISTTVQKTPKGEAKGDIAPIRSEASSNIDFLGIRMDPNKPESIQIEPKQKSPKSEDKRRSSCAMCGKTMYTRNMKRHVEIMHSLAMNIAKVEYKTYQSKPVLNTPNNFDNRHQNDDAEMHSSAMNVAKVEYKPYQPKPVLNTSNDFNNRQQNDDKGSRSLCPICGRNMYTRNMKQHIAIRHGADTINGNGIGLDYDSNQSSISKTFENDAQNDSNTSPQPLISQQTAVQISVMPDLPTRNLLGMIVDPLYAGQNTSNMQYNQSNQSLNEQEQQPKFRYKDVKSKCPICEKEMYGRNIKRHMQVMHPVHDNVEQPVGDPNLRVD